MRNFQDNWDEAMDKIARGQKINNKKVIITDLSWNMSSNGCRECINVSMTSVYAAYAESRRCEEW